MFEIIESISTWALGVIDKSGYLGLFLLSALESAAIPIPSEVVVPFSGFLAFSGRFEFSKIIFYATLGNLIGSLAIYFISLIGGRKFFEKFGKYFLVSRHDLERADNLFKRHGPKIIFIGRMLPVVRTFVSIPAGVARMNFLKFSVYTFIGSFPWNFILAFSGFKAGENWNFLSRYFHQFDFVIIGALVVGLIWYLYSRLNNKRLIKH